jgi:hypothetical protein
MHLLLIGHTVIIGSIKNADKRYHGLLVAE